MNNVGRNERRQLGYLSLFTGGGGLDLAVCELLRIVRPIAYVEIEAFCLAHLVEQMQASRMAVAPIATDIKELAESGDCERIRDSVDLVVGGYPCQPFSVCGKRRGESDPRHLWPYVARVVQTCQPSLCFFENVSGHLTLGFEQVARELEGMGYEVAADLFTASEVGATHKRERLFILAVANGLTASVRETTTGGKEKKRRTTPSVTSEKVVKTLEDNQHKRLERAKCEVVEEQNNRRLDPDIAGSDSIFPPGPDDINEWGRILKTDSSLEPAICGMADGMASRMDRLRMLGNGVVPIQAAYAFCSLWACITNNTYRRKETVMCNPISGYIMMVNGTPKVWVSEKTDSHTEIAKEFNLRDDEMRTGKLYAFEFYPNEREPSPDLDTWTLDWDSDATSGCRENPSDEDEIEFRSAITRRCEKYVVTDVSHTLEKGRLFAFGVSEVTQSGGECWAYNNVTIAQSGGELKAFENSTVTQSGGECWARGKSTVDQSGGELTAFGNSTVTQSGGKCWAWDKSTVDQSGGECWARGNSTVTQSGGECWAWGNSTVNQSGGECTITKYFTGAYNKVGDGPMTLIDRRKQ